MDIDYILLDLEIIRQLDENDKLGVTILPGQKRLSVDKYNIISMFTRKYYGYNRESCIDYLNTLVENIEKSSKIITTGHHDHLAETLKNAITNAINGLQHLQNTYSYDSIIAAKLVLIINKLTLTTVSLSDNLLAIAMTMREINTLEADNE